MSKNIATFQKGFEHSLGNGFMFFSPSEVFGKRVDLSLTFDAIINRLKLLHIKNVLCALINKWNEMKTYLVSASSMPNFVLGAKEKKMHETESLL